jgi:hypothetical protein
MKYHQSRNTKEIKRNPLSGLIPDGILIYQDTKEEGFLKTKSMNSREVDAIKIS